MPRVEHPLIEIGLLAFWLGAAVLFAAVVAPAAFAVLPTRTLAGAIVGRVLPAIFYAGMLVGVVVIVLELRGGGGWRWGGPETAASVIVVACAIAQLVIGPRIERVRAAIEGPVDALPAGDARRAAFGRLHALSVGWLGLAMLAAAVGLVLAGRAWQARR